MSAIRAWFYSPNGDSRHWLNDLVVSLDGPFSHCELQFDTGEASSIYYGTCARLVVRDFDRVFYTPVTVPCTRAQHDSALAFARAAVDTPFSALAMTNAYIQLPLRTNGTFCSKLNADTLVSAGILTPRNTSNITPSALYRALLALMPVPAMQQVRATPALDWAPLPVY